MYALKECGRILSQSEGSAVVCKNSLASLTVGTYFCPLSISSQALSMWPCMGLMREREDFKHHRKRVRFAHLRSKKRSPAPLYRLYGNK